MLRVEKNLSTNSITSYKTDLERYINFLYDGESIRELDSIRQIHIRNFIRFLNDQNLSSSTINRSFSSIRSYHKYLSYEKKLHIILLSCLNLLKFLKNYRKFCLSRK